LDVSGGLLPRGCRGGSRLQAGGRFGQLILSADFKYKRAVFNRPFFYLHCTSLNRCP
jgi:hypothetical protein